MNVLSELVGEEQLNYFFECHFGKFPYAKPYKANSFVDLINWKFIKEILPVHQDSWLPLKGQLPLDENLNSGVLTYEQALENFKKGRTLLLRHAEKSHSKMALLENSFKRWFFDPLDIQIYVTPENEEGFSWHYDLEDVFVIQCKGEKEFSLLPNTVTPRPLAPMTAQNCKFHLENKQHQIKCWLKEGDWLYIPAGYWHKARALKESFHLSVGVLRGSSSLS